MDYQIDFERSMATLLALQYEELQRLTREAEAAYQKEVRRLLDIWASRDPYVQELQFSEERLENQPENPNRGDGGAEEWDPKGAYAIYEVIIYPGQKPTGDEGAKDCSPLRSGGDEPRVNQDTNVS